MVTDQLAGIQRESTSRHHDRVCQRFTLGGVGGERVDQFENVSAREVTDVHEAHGRCSLQLAAQLCRRRVVTHRPRSSDPPDAAHRPLHHVVDDGHLGGVQPLDVIEEHGGPALGGDGAQALDEVAHESEAPTIVVLCGHRRLEWPAPARELGQRLRQRRHDGDATRKRARAGNIRHGRAVAAVGDLGQQAGLPGSRTTFDPHDGAGTEHFGELLVPPHERIATRRHASRTDREVSLGPDQLALDVEQLG